MFPSYANPPVEGTCRMCAETRHDVIRIFGEQGRRLQLAEKLDEYMSIKIFAWDNLPRVLCQICMACVLLAAKYYGSDVQDTGNSQDEELLLPWDLSRKSMPNSQ